MVSIILAITFLIFSYNEMMPRVSYIKAMDIYLGVCFMAVFFSLAKLSLIKFMRQKLYRNRYKSSKNRIMKNGSLIRNRYRKRSTLATPIFTNVNSVINDPFNETSIVSSSKGTFTDFDLPISRRR
ncbi:hypothetical protein X798_07370 [Onchocerca flexuosa]|uniref:Neurotransmitter-gated ion-channel transmembrane domain-containing protein n=1 Tax=Onchocerca flexuosa TaxID=387005 RepID=A0A238BL89_9BILA|nr:hypothetical protein X798_07370 [Onchocerca flexuosa]